jgi:nitroreductase/NAD-dependent dihydropyrimidine dehydrogenase PreA subunit
MIVVDRETCEGCGLCAEICHEDCIGLVHTAGGAVASVHQPMCSTCTQCIAICPRRALSWDGVPPVAYDRARLPSPEQLDELLKERRTIRFFKDEMLDRALVEEIVGYGIYAPTNNYHLRAVVVDDPSVIEALDSIIIRYVWWLYNLFFRSKIVFQLIHRITPSMQATDKVKMEGDLARGHTFDRPPPATVFVVGDRRIGLSEASAQYALYNMILVAQAKGIGSRLKGTGQILLDRSKAARRRLGLGKHEHILGSLELGYPDVKFRNKVEGKKMRITWIDGEAGSAEEAS